MIRFTYVRRIACLSLAVCLPALAQNAFDLATISAIRTEGLQDSQAMDSLSWLADVYGPRLTGSPEILDASDWAIKKFNEWGLANAHREYWKMGEGWALLHFDANMVEPQNMPIIGLPLAWTPGTNGPVTAEVVHPTLDGPSDFEQWRGKLRGKIVLLQPIRKVDLLELPLTFRYSDQDLAQAEETPIPRQWLAGELAGGATGWPSRGIGLLGDHGVDAVWQDQLIRFLKQEGVVAVIDRGADGTTVKAGPSEQIPQMIQRTDGGTVFVDMSQPGLDNRNRLLPWITIAVEQYNRMMRILDHGLAVKVELNDSVAWYPEKGDGNGFNTIAEIPGSDLKDQIVFIGAHFDGKHAATGATDDGAGSAAMMEAVRILMRLGIKPRRTIRIGLWGGEELGILGSQAYITKHYGDPASGQYTPDSRKVSVYFNLDNGSGRIRGIWLQNNIAAQSTLATWIDPVRDLGVTTLARRGTVGTLHGTKLAGGTDHLSFDAVGIPAFQFIQDRLEYFSRTSHSNMDYLDHASKNDLIQMSVVAAVMAYEASMADEPVPRKLPPPALEPH